MQKNFLTLIIGLSFICTSQELKANTNEDPYLLPKVVAVENKLYEPKYDLTVNVGVLPLDAFYKGLTVGASYTYSINSFLAWELFNAQYSSNEDTGLKKDLISNFNVQPTGILDEINYFVVTSLVYTPIYSKNLFFNETLKHGSISFIGSGGSVRFQSGDNGALFGGGLMLRFFSSNWLSYKLDTRVFTHTAKNKSSDLLLSVNFGLSFEFGENKVKTK